MSIRLALWVTNKTEPEENPIQETINDKESRGGSHEITYECHTRGQSLSEIAKERGLTLNTVIGHLIRCDQEGKTVDWSGFVDPEKEKEILDAIESVGLDALKPIKTALPETCSYDDIKIVNHKNDLK